MSMSGHYAPSKAYILDYVFCQSFVLASTLWCTLFIIYRIVTVTRSAGGLNAYRHVIEVLVESSALYSISLILFVTFYVRNDAILYYFVALLVITRVHHQFFSCLSISQTFFRESLRHSSLGASQLVMLAQMNLGRKAPHPHFASQQILEVKILSRIPWQLGVTTSKHSGRWMMHLAVTCWRAHGRILRTRVSYVRMSPLRGWRPDS